MVLFFRRRIPQLSRIVVVESGDRQILEQLLPFLYRETPEIDLVTCYGGTPSSFRNNAGQVYQIGSYSGSEGRARLVNELKARGHAAVGIICSAQPIMTKWKWMLAARVPSKLFIINENGDHFWVDYSNWRIMLHFILFRAGLSGADAVNTIGRLLLFPFTLLFLIFYAVWVHSRRLLRKAFQA